MIPNEVLINITNCGTISEGNIKIIKDNLNIKYAINGSGKSTISDILGIKIPSITPSLISIHDLIPYNKRGSNPVCNPEITGIEGFSKIAIFNERYINSILFKDNEVINDSFEIFFKTDDYDEKMGSIADRIKELSIFFEEDQNIIELIDKLGLLSNQAKTTSNGALHGSSFFKTTLVDNGNKIANIPPELNLFKSYIENSDKRIKWIKRQLEGEQFSHINDSCPRCVSVISPANKKIITSIGEHYKANDIKNLDEIITTFGILDEYFNEEDQTKVKEVLTSSSPSQQQIDYILSIKKEGDNILSYLQTIKSINFASLKDETDIEGAIRVKKIDLSLITYFKSALFISKAENINSSIDRLIVSIGGLIGDIRMLNDKINGTVEKYKFKINEFLKQGGYKYEIDNKEIGGKYTIVLKHNELTEPIINYRLSFGERNAFAIILFMYHAINQEADLIVLDDPISSFDKNKKYAILNGLFNGVVQAGSPREDLLNKTVLLLTHDFEPIIDIIYNGLPRCIRNLSNATFLSNKGGILEEKPIIKHDILLCTKLLEEKIRNNDVPNENKIIYLRRLMEIQNKEQNLEVYNLISNLVHKQITLKKKIYDTTLNDIIEIDISQEEIDNTTHIIQNTYGISDFAYSNYLTRITNTQHLISLYEGSTVNFEKMQLYRLIIEKNKNIDREEVAPGYELDPNETIMKFINESFHIENDSLFQLDHAKYETIPNFIIDECDKDIVLIKTAILRP